MAGINSRNTKNRFGAIILFFLLSISTVFYGVISLENDIGSLINFIFMIGLSLVFLMIGLSGLRKPGNKGARQVSQVDIVASYLVGVFLVVGPPLLFLIFTGNIWSGLFIYIFTFPTGTFILISTLFRKNKYDIE